MKAAKDDGRLPMEDHHTRIIVFGREGAGQGRSGGYCTGRLVLHDWNEATCRAILRQRDRLLRAIYLLTRLIGIVVSCVMAWASFSKVVSSWLILTVAETPVQKGPL
ncbi:MAG: hypothetical protein ACRERE_19990 [Candidatus Entotheonellia bacterium]